MSISGEKNYLHSPDLEYLTKIIRVCQCIEEARTHDDVIALFQDEFTFYQQPTVANGWDRKGKSQPLARLGCKGNRKCRIVGALDVSNGAVIFDQRSKIGVVALVAFCKQIRKQYPSARIIYVIMDNWPIHYHPKVLQAAVEANLQFVPLPTYAPWTNPIEKLCRWLYQDILHLHRHTDQWILIMKLVTSFLNQFEQGSEELLPYVGLSNGKIPAAPPDWKEIIDYKETILIPENGAQYTEPHREELPV